MEEILKAFIVQLSTIRVSNGYSTDIGQEIQYWAEIPRDYQGSGAIAIYDQPPEEAQTFATVGQKHERVMPVTIEARCFETPNASMLELSCRLIEDIVKCIGANKTLNGLILCPILKMTHKEIDVAGSRAVNATVIVDLKYRTEAYQGNLDPARQ